MKAELFLDAKAKLGEGPLYHEEDGLLYWVDIEGRLIHRTNPQTAEDSVIETPSRPGMLRFSRDDVLYTGLEDGLYRYDGMGEFTRAVALPPRDRVRSNDGGCDPEGRLWLGTMELSAKKEAAALYRIEGSEITEMIPDATISNGLCFSPDDKYMYYIDTPTGHLWRFDYDRKTGAIENRTPIIDYREEPGNFDGMAMDSEGLLWVAHFGGGRITVWNPVTGKKEGELLLPVPNITCCAFAGERYDTLFITTASSKDNPQSGGLFVCRDTGAKGLPAFRYRS